MMRLWLISILRESLIQEYVEFTRTIKEVSFFLRGLAMFDNKMSLSAINVCKIKKYSALILAGFIVLVLAVSSDVHAAGKVKADGVLTSIEDDGTVIISGTGYLLSRSLTVLDHEERSISLRDINLPCHVYFEYEYSPEGFTIIRIKETAA
jgi:hypothetical protein